MTHAAQVPDAWSRLVRAIEQMPEILKDAAPFDEPEGLRYLTRFLQAGLRVCIEADETQLPSLTRPVESRMTWGLDNPDATYLYSRLAPGRSYRLTGRRGSARHLEIQVSTGHHADADPLHPRTLWSITGPELGAGTDQEIDLEIPPHVDASYLLVRQYFSDWDTEAPARLTLTCPDVPLPPTPLAGPDIEARIDLLVHWLTAGLGGWHELSRGFVSSVDGLAEWEVQPTYAPNEALSLKGEALGIGGWQCAPDEAVVLTLRPPPGRYWGVSLTDQWWQSIDADRRQSSLNDSQAVRDRGVEDIVTFVISHDDPGIENWLDPGGRTEGSLAVRYLEPAGDVLPPVRAVRVKRDRLSRAVSTGAIRTKKGKSRQPALLARQAAVARRTPW